MNSTLLETPEMKLWIENGILYCEYTKEIYMDLDIAKKNVQTRMDFVKGQSYPACIFLKDFRSVDKSAREYLAKEGAELLTAAAFICESALTRSLGNFFLVVNKPKIPLRLFKEKTAAENWLREFAE